MIHWVPDIASGIGAATLVRLSLAYIDRRKRRTARQTALFNTFQKQMLYGRTGSRLQKVWADYYDDKISVVSAILRIEQLFAARVKEITDWDAVDWTTSPLEPVGGVYAWKGDQLLKDVFGTSRSTGYLIAPGLTTQEATDVLKWWTTPGAVFPPPESADDDT